MNEIAAVSTVFAVTHLHDTVVNWKMSLIYEKRVTDSYQMHKPVMLAKENCNFF